MVTASIRRLEVFKTVVELEGVNAAAEHLGVSQPSVTAHIKALELQTGTPLFVRQRGRRHLRLSTAGDALYRYACETIIKSNELTDSLRSARSEEAHRLMIAAQRVLANNVLPGAIADFLIEHTAARVVLHSETQEHVWELIRSGPADVGLLFSWDQPQDLRSELVGHLDLKFIAAPNHALAKRTSIEPAELAEYGFVGGLQESEFFGLILRSMADIGLAGCRFVLNLQDSVAIKRAVAKNVGLALTFPIASQEEIARGELLVLPVTGKALQLPIYYVRRSSSASASAKLGDAFAQQVRRHLGSLPRS